VSSALLTKKPDKAENLIRNSPHCNGGPEKKNFFRPINLMKKTDKLCLNM
jgi:hypothetical protein